MVYNIRVSFTSFSASYEIDNLTMFLYLFSHSNIFIVNDICIWILNPIAIPIVIPISTLRIRHERMCMYAYAKFQSVNNSLLFTFILNDVSHSLTICHPVHLGRIKRMKQIRT